jgi:integrative and conjugative element protein (TIGR02256 family)
MDYIGEWHTHPENDPQPSTLDLDEWCKICSRREDPMVFLIQGTLRQWVGVGLGDATKASSEADNAVANPDSGAREPQRAASTKD